MQVGQFLVSELCKERGICREAMERAAKGDLGMHNIVWVIRMPQAQHVAKFMGQ